MSLHNHTHRPSRRGDSLRDTINDAALCSVQDCLVEWYLDRFASMHAVRTAHQPHTEPSTRPLITLAACLNASMLLELYDPVSQSQHGQ